MKFAFRLLGTWLIGIALVLLIVDGTRMLAVTEFVYTPLHQTWEALDSASLSGLREIVVTRMHAAIWNSLIWPLLSLPGWALFGLPGLMFAIAGAKRAPRAYRKFEQL